MCWWYNCHVWVMGYKGVHGRHSSWSWFKTNGVYLIYTDYIWQNKCKVPCSKFLHYFPFVKIDAGFLLHSMLTDGHKILCDMSLTIALVPGSLKIMFYWSHKFQSHLAKQRVLPECHHSNLDSSVLPYLL